MATQLPSANVQPKPYNILLLEALPPLAAVYEIIIQLEIKVKKNIAQVLLSQDSH